MPDIPPTRERVDRFAAVTHTGHGLFVKTSDKPDGIITITLQYRDPETGVDRPAQAAVVWDLSKDSPDVAIAESLIWHLKELIRTNGVQR